MEKNVVYASKEMRHQYMNEVSADVRETILEAVRESLIKSGLADSAVEWGMEAASASRLCDLEDDISIEYLESEPLKFYVVNNLRSQQDKTPFEVSRFNTIDMAYECYSQYPSKYTSALGVTASSGREIDIVHSRQGQPVLVTDYRNIPGFKDNPLVLQAIHHAIGHLGIQHEGNYSLFNQWVEIPLSKEVSEPDRYLGNKRLLPAKGSSNLRSAINEAFCEGRGWVKAEDLFSELNDYDPYSNPVHLKISYVNVNYITTDTHEVGQMDLVPSSLALLMEKSKEPERKPSLDSRIGAAKQSKGDSNTPERDRDNHAER